MIYCLLHVAANAAMRSLSACYYDANHDGVYLFRFHYCDSLCQCYSSFLSYPPMAPLCTHRYSISGHLCDHDGGPFSKHVPSNTNVVMLSWCCGGVWGLSWFELMFSGNKRWNGTKPCSLEKVKIRYLFPNTRKSTENTIMHIICLQWMLPIYIIVTIASNIHNIHIRCLC